MLHLWGFKFGCDELLLQLCQNLTGLKAITISFTCPKQSIIMSLIEHARNLRVLKIKCDSHPFSAKFYRKLVRLRKETHLKENLSTLTIEFDRKFVNECIQELGTRSYKPAIITLSHI